MFYLCSPYTSLDALVCQSRFEAACRAGRRVDSPRQERSILRSSTAMALCRYGLPSDWRFWERHDRRFLEACDEVIVLMLPGWEASIGVQAEIAIARELRKPVTYLDACPSEWNLSGKPGTHSFTRSRWEIYSTTRDVVRESERFPSSLAEPRDMVLERRHPQERSPDADRRSSARIGSVRPGDIETVIDGSARPHCQLKGWADKRFRWREIQRHAQTSVSNSVASPSSISFRR